MTSYNSLYMVTEDIYASTISLTDQGKYDLALDQLGTYTSNTPIVLLLQTEIHLVRGNVEKAEDKLNTLSAMDRTAIVQIAFETLTAIMYWIRGNMDTVDKYLNQARESTDEVESDMFYWYYWLSYLNNAEGLFQIQSGHSQKARLKFEQAYHVAKQSTSKRREASALDNMAIAHRYLGEFDRAITYQKRVLRMRQDLNNTHTIAITKGNLAELFEITGKVDQSIAYTKEALDIFKDHGSVDEQAQCHHNLGRIAYQQNRSTEAYNHFKQAYHMRQDLDNPIRLASDLYYLVLVALELDNPSAARQYLTELLAIDSEDTTPIGIYQNLTRATYLLNTTRDHTAIADLLEAVIDHNNYNVELTYIAIIKLIQLELSSPRDPEHINNHLTLLRRMAHDSGNLWLNTEVLVLNAKFKMSHRDINQAIIFLDQAQELADQNDYNRLQTRISRLRSDWKDTLTKPQTSSKETQSDDMESYIDHILRKLHRRRK